MLLTSDFHIWGGVDFFHTVLEGRTNYLPPYPGSTVRYPLASESKMLRNTQSQQVPHLEMCILTSRVGLYSEPPAEITDDQGAQSAMMTMDPSPNNISSTFTRLIYGPLDDFLAYSREENSRWLIDIAHDICDPRLRRGSLRVWDVAAQEWRNLNPTDPLTASIYLYHIQDVVSLSKISVCVSKSKTAATGIPATMAGRVKARDGHRCWLTRFRWPLVNSHVCPKRMGDHLLRVVWNTFVLAPPPPALSIYDEMIGITLYGPIDSLFDIYQCGLRLVAPVRNPPLLAFYS